MSVDDRLLELLRSCKDETESLEEHASRNSEVITRMTEVTHNILKTATGQMFDEKCVSPQCNSDIYALELENIFAEMECQLLYKERDRLLDELNDGNAILHVLSADHANLEKEVKLVDDLQAQIYRLKKEILNKDNEITHFHIENNHLRLSNGQLLRDVAQALHDDEEEYAKECNNEACNL